MFCGWIPAVSGRLSFSVFGQSEHPTKSISAHAADRTRRYLVVYQRRITADAVVPLKSLLLPALHLDGDFIFLFLASTDDGRLKQEFLRGRAFIFRRRSGWTMIKREIRKYRDYLNEFRFSRDEKVTDFAKEKHEYFMNECTRFCVFCVDVSIRRTGTTEIFPVIEHDGYHDAPNLPCDSKEREHILYILSAQIFYFLKDIGHRHQNHDPTTDTVVDLYTKGDNIEWRMSSLYNIYRKVI